MLRGWSRAAPPSCAHPRAAPASGGPRPRAPRRRPPRSGAGAAAAPRAGAPRHAAPPPPPAADPAPGAPASPGPFISQRAGAEHPVVRLLPCRNPPAVQCCSSILRGSLADVDVNTTVLRRPEDFRVVNCSIQGEGCGPVPACGPAASCARLQSGVWQRPHQPPASPEPCSAAGCRAALRLPAWPMRTRLPSACAPPHAACGAKVAQSAQQSRVYMQARCRARCNGHCILLRCCAAAAR